ncbi:MAG TPA: hypothetical protein VK402_03950 [Blastococcus sp.]|nr:hypothetical protein [Blastococcus sp.]
MSETQATRDDANERFEEAVRFAFQDAQQRRLRYHLLRLTVAGLSHDEVRPLVELGRLAFDGADVTEQASSIKERPGATPLGSALASIVERGPVSDQFATRADVLIGAVTGAYAGLRNASSGDGTQAAVLGAVGGGTAAAVGRFVRERITEVGEIDYLEPDERT